MKYLVGYLLATSLVLYAGEVPAHAKAYTMDLVNDRCPGLSMRYIPETKDSASIIQYWKDDSEIKLLAIVTSKILDGHTAGVYKIRVNDIFEESVVTSITDVDEIIKYLSLQLDLLKTLHSELKIPVHEIRACESDFLRTINKR